MQDFYSAMTDPNGGREDRTTSSSIGMFAVDFGLGLWPGGNRIGGWLGKSSRLYHNNVYKHATRTGINRIFSNMSNPGMPGYGRETVNSLRRSAITTKRANRVASSKITESFGRNLKGLGLLAGGLGMIDLAVTIGMSLGSPGAARDISMAQVLNGDESYLDSRQAYTQRQNALRAISESSLGAGRAILGQEASFIHSR
jgi:hypothetical protein